MRTKNVTTIATYGVLGLAAAGVLMMPASVIPVAYATPIEPLSWDPPDAVRLNGVVRDFRSTHDDFDVTPADGFGHRAGNVALSLGPGNRPVFNAGSDVNGPFENRVAHWKFDEGTGTIASDEMGRNPGSVISGSWTDEGRDGGAMEFDGDDYIEIASSPDIQIKGDITFTGWFKLADDFDGTQDTQVIMERFQDTNHDFHIGLAVSDYNRSEVPKGTLVFKVENGPTSDYYCYVWTQRRTWASDTWYHFACSLDSGNTAANTIFINGSDNTDSAIADGVGYLDTDYDAPMRIGGMTIDYNGHATDIYFEGMIDDVMIFDRALSPGDFEVKPGGFIVDAQWYDSDGHKIAPHLETATDPAHDTMFVVSAPSVTHTPTIDSYESSAGTYGGTNVDAPVTVATGATMPAVAVPSGLPFTTSVNHDGLGTTNIHDDVHCDDFFIGNNHLLKVHGDVTVVANNSFRVRNSALVELQPGASLTVYSLSDTEFNNSIELNVRRGDPTKVNVYHLGTTALRIDNSAEVHGYFYAPSATLELQNTSHLYGRFMGQSMDIRNNHTGYHHDRSGAPVYDACGDEIADAAGAAGAASDGGIMSANSFGEWFQDVLGTNLSTQHAITLDLNGSVYEYIDNAMYPVDDSMLGNEGDAHNKYFTYTIAALFTYEACGGQFIEFEGGDGAWLYVNGDLGIDLGGVISGHEQRVDLDRMGLVDGELYEMRLFYSQRNANSSSFSLRTNVVLEQYDHLSVSAGFD